MLTNLAALSFCRLRSRPDAPPATVVSIVMATPSVIEAASGSRCFLPCMTPRVAQAPMQQPNYRRAVEDPPSAPPFSDRGSLWPHLGRIIRDVNLNLHGERRRLWRPEYLAKCDEKAISMPNSGSRASYGVCILRNHQPWTFDAVRNHPSAADSDPFLPGRAIAAVSRSYAPPRNLRLDDGCRTIGPESSSTFSVVPSCLYHRGPHGSELPPSQKIGYAPNLNLCSCRLLAPKKRCLSA